MKKISIFLFIFTSIALSTSLAACSVQQPQVTATSEVTITSLPPTATIIPTSTLHPQFIEVQEQIAASGETFTLLSDGTIEQSTSEGAMIVPGLSVDINGVMTLQGESSQVTISPEDVSFDVTKGVNVAGYTLDEATGLWGVEVTSLSIENLDAKKWGNYSLIENPDGYYEMKDAQGNLIPEVKLFRDGTVDLTYNSKTYTVAFEATKIGSDGSGVYGYWDLKDGQLVLAPGYTAEQVRAGEIGDGVHGITIVRGEGEIGDAIEAKLTKTIFELRDLLMKNSAKEFEGLTVTDMNGNIIENFDGPARSWKILGSTLNDATYYFQADLKKPGIVANDGSNDAKVRPLQVAINEENAAYFPIRIINPKTKQEMNVLHVPVVAKEPGKIINLSALINTSDLPRLAPYLESKDTRGSLFIWLIKGTQSNLHPNIISNPVLLGFQGEINSDAFFNKPGVFTYNPQDNYRSLPVEFEDVFFTFLEPND